MRKLIEAVAALLSPAKVKSKPAQSQPIESRTVSIASYAVRAGTAEQSAIREGLQQLADVFSTEVEIARRTVPGLTGSLSGTLHIEPTGKVRMFAIEKKAISDDTEPSITQSLMQSIFSGKASFPPLQDHCLLAVSLQVKPPI